MKKVILVCSVLVSCATAWSADRDLLTPEPQRITDEAIAADIKVMENLQGRLAALNRKDIPIASYHFAKAQAWLDFALDEYTINDRSRVTEEALHQALALIEQLEARKQDISMSTPIIPTSSVVRTDLWDRAETLKKNISPYCAGDKIAQLEVQLVWAGHEEKELGWRHAKPYLQAAECLAREAETQMDECQSFQARETLPLSPASGAVSEPRDMQAGTAVPDLRNEPVLCPPCKESLPAAILNSLEPPPDRIHFALDSAVISAASKSILDRIAAAMQRDESLRIYLYGHADQRGSVSYNLNLSLRRAESVRASLISAGVAAERISLAPFGKAMPLSQEKSVDAYARNRRVEFYFTIGSTLPVTPQQGDLQPEKIQRP